MHEDLEDLEDALYARCLYESSAGMLLGGPRMKTV